LKRYKYLAELQLGLLLGLLLVLSFYIRQSDRLFCQKCTIRRSFEGCMRSWKLYVRHCLNNTVFSLYERRIAKTFLSVQILRPFSGTIWPFYKRYSVLRVFLVKKIQFNSENSFCLCGKNRKCECYNEMLAWLKNWSREMHSRDSLVPHTHARKKNMWCQTFWILFFFFRRKNFCLTFFFLQMQKVEQPQSSLSLSLSLFLEKMQVHNFCCVDEWSQREINDRK
jgi:hypothetical protein